MYLFENSQKKPEIATNPCLQPQQMPKIQKNNVKVIFFLLALGFLFQTFSNTTEMLKVFFTNFRRNFDFSQVQHTKTKQKFNNLVLHINSLSF